MLFNYLLPLCLVCMATSMSEDGFPNPEDFMGPFKSSEMSRGIDVDERIWRGDDASVGQFPYQALLYMTNEDDTHSFCGGSLITTKDILTAAHCCDGVKETLVFLGLLDVANINDNYIQRFKVASSEFAVHPDYDSKTISNDICILHLPAEAQLNSNVSLITLPSEKDDSPSQYNYKYANISGWGQTNNNEGLHPKLQYSTVYLQPHVICSIAYLFINRVSNSQLCSGKIFKYTGPCHGDSGGPLTILEGDKNVEIGLVSWGVGGCSSFNPVVYTYVPYFLPWIKENMS